MAARPALTLVVVGFGNVSRRLLRLLDEAAGRLPFTWTLAGVCSRTRGRLIDPAGLDHRACLDAAERGLVGRAPATATGWLFSPKRCRRCGRRARAGRS